MFDTERVEKEAKALCEKFKNGTRVYGKKEDGKWYKATSLGYQDWRLFTTYFLVKFDDGDIIELPSDNMSLMNK